MKRLPHVAMLVVAVALFAAKETEVPSKVPASKGELALGLDKPSTVDEALLGEHGIKPTLDGVSSYLRQFVPNPDLEKKNIIKMILFELQDI